MNIISYALFGARTQHKDSFEFRSYFRMFSVNLRMAAVLYPDWKVCLHIDEDSYQAYSRYFDYHINNQLLDLYFMPTSELCKMMLYRVAPVFMDKYDRVICRDTDSLITYKDRQCVRYWEKGGRIMHTETDSISHTVALMGGMIGMMCKEFREAVGCNTFEEMLALGSGIDYNRKGSDQDFLNRHILPKVAHSMTEHYLLGMPQSFRGDCHHTVSDVNIHVDSKWKETNSFGWHLGASGFQVDATIKMLREQGEKSDLYDVAERYYPEVFYWML